MGTKRKRERPKHRRAREEALRQLRALEFRAKLRRAVLGWLACAAGSLICVAILVFCLRHGQMDTGQNYFGMPVGPILWATVGIFIAVGFAIAIWQWTFGKPTKPPKASPSRTPPVDLTSWKKW